MFKSSSVLELAMMSDRKRVRKAKKFVQLNENTEQAIHGTILINEINSHYFVKISQKFDFIIYSNISTKFNQ